MAESQSIMISERSKLKRLHITWFHLYDILEKMKVLGQKSDQWFQETEIEKGLLVTKECEETFW